MHRPKKGWEGGVVFDTGIPRPKKVGVTGVGGRSLQYVTLECLGPLKKKLRRGGGGTISKIYAIWYMSD